MRFEMDFLPASFRAAERRRQARRSSVYMILIVLAGIVMNEGVWRTRLYGLRSSRSDLRGRTGVASRRAEEVQQVQRDHQTSLEELGGWAASLRARRASVVIDGILAARLPSMSFQEVAWKSGGVSSEAQPSLRIAGATNRLQDLSNFIEVIEESVGPRLEVRRSGIRSRFSEEAMQEFVLESIAGQEERP